MISTRLRPPLRCPPLPALALCLLVGGACAAPGPQPVLRPAGGSVADFDRGLSPSDPRHGVETGNFAFTGIPTDEAEPESSVPSAPTVRVPVPGRPIAGPIQPSAAQPSPETMREVQRRLAERGYYQGAVDGQPDAALVDALLRYQADQGLLLTGTLDAATATRLGIERGGGPPPPRGG